MYMDIHTYCCIPAKCDRAMVLNLFLINSGFGLVRDHKRAGASPDLFGDKIIVFDSPVPIQPSRMSILRQNEDALRKVGIYIPGPMAPAQWMIMNRCQQKAYIWD